MAKASNETRRIIFDILSKALDSTDLTQTDYISFIEDRMCINYPEYERFRMTESIPAYPSNPKRRVTIYRRYQNWLIDVIPTQKDEEVLKVMGKIIKKCERQITHIQKYLVRKPLKSLTV